ncbi:MAG: putative toxin-antitoxin system toxin component, PIN family [Bacteroidales bacterium]|nr:putative toxin-antitoxin system toxin component, PIN family [Bacteroidales bacterium]
MENRTVFDTNIWISHFLKEEFGELIKMRRESDVLFLRSAPSLSELKEVITRKKFASKNFDVKKLLDFYTGIAEFCETKPLFKDCSDPKDNFLFDLAIQGKAKFLVSGDKKVLETKLENAALTLSTLTNFKETLK